MNYYSQQNNFWGQNFIDIYHTYQIKEIFPKYDITVIKNFVKSLYIKINRFRVRKINIPVNFILHFCYIICPIINYYPLYFKRNILSVLEIIKKPEYYYNMFIIYYYKFNLKLLMRDIKKFEKLNNVN